MRKGNILIGDNRTLNPIFREARFNGWIQGELFVITDKLIPNARRDDFEQNEAYYQLIQGLKDSIGNEITKVIRETSQMRNDVSTKIISEVQQQVNNAVVSVEEGFNSSVDKSKLLDTLSRAEEKLKRTIIRDDLKTKKKELQKQLADTKETVSESGNYKMNRINSGIDKKSKRILATVSDILSERLSKSLVDEIIDEIIKVLNKKVG